MHQENKTSVNSTGVEVPLHVDGVREVQEKLNLMYKRFAKSVIGFFRRIPPCVSAKEHHKIKVPWEHNGVVTMLECVVPRIPASGSRLGSPTTQQAKQARIENTVNEINKELSAITNISPSLFECEPTAYTQCRHHHMLELCRGLDEHLNRYMTTNVKPSHTPQGTGNPTDDKQHTAFFDAAHKLTNALNKHNKEGSSMNNVGYNLLKVECINEPLTGTPVTKVTLNGMEIKGVTSIYIDCGTKKQGSRTATFTISADQVTIDGKPAADPHTQDKVTDPSLTIQL